MANVKITELTAATALAGTDVLPIVDVGADATKKVSVSDLLRNLPDGTASAPALAFADDQNSGVLSPAENELAFATSGTQRLVIDSNGQVGIGLASPSQLVDCSSGGNAVIRLNSGSTSTTGVMLARGGTEVARVSSDGTDILKFSVGSSAVERMRIHSSGKVGIGTSSPSSPLHISSSEDRLLLLQSSDANAYLAFQDSDSSSNAANRVGTVSDGLYFNTGGGGERMRIDNSGNVGIGTASNLLANSTRRTLSLNHTGSSAVAFGVNGTRDGHIYVYNDEMEISAEDNFMYFTAGSSERMRIDSSGRLLLGTTTEGQADADNLTIADSGNCGITIRSGTTNTGSIFFSDGTSGNAEYDGFIEYNQNSRFMRFGTTSAERMRIDGLGNVAIGTTTIGSAPLTLYSSASRTMYQGSSTGTGNGNGFTTGNNGGANAFVWNYENGFIQFATNNTERMRIDSSGRLLVGTSSSSATNTVVIQGHSGGSSGQGLVYLAKGSATPANGDQLGAIWFSDNTHTASAGVNAARDGGTWSGSSKPSRLVFSTTADSASSPTERMRITNSGQVMI
jgi:hypothetical protein